MQKITSLSAIVFGRQSKEFQKIGGQAFWPRLYIVVLDISLFVQKKWTKF